VRERILYISLKEAVQLFESTKWKFYEVDEEEEFVRVEVPRSSGETFVVELPYKGSQTILDGATKTLGDAGFIRQTVRLRSDW